LEELDQVLIWATREVGPEYFLLPIDGQSAVYRERVYCYELYHRMRSCWPDGPYTLNGEVDKAGHQKLREVNADKCKPDLLVHVPGDMYGNFAVIEVKPCSADARGLRKDLLTLQLFSQKVGYRRAIYLIYGERADAAAAKVSNLLSEASFPELELWVHRNRGTPAVKL